MLQFNHTAFSPISIQPSNGANSTTGVRFMPNTNYLTLKHGQTAVFTSKTKIIVSPINTEVLINSPEMNGKTWYECFVKDFSLGESSLVNDLSLAQLLKLCSPDTDLKNHDFVVDTLLCDSDGIAVALNEIEHTVVIG